MENLAAAPAAANTRWIDLSLIDIPKNARPHTPEDLESLAQDMEKEGQLQEIVVVAQSDRFEVVAGVGRTLAAQKLKWEKIRCFVKDSLSEFDRLHITFSENEEREDATPIYQADLLDKMMKSGNLSQQELAGRLGKTQQWIGNYVALMNLAPKVQEITKRLVNLGIGHLMQISRLKIPEDQIALAQEASDKELSVKELKALVDKKVVKNDVQQNDVSPSPVAEDTIDQCHFRYTGKVVTVKPRAFRMGKESIDEWSIDVKANLVQFITGLGAGNYKKKKS